jgi:hypothetical protein
MDTTEHIEGRDILIETVGASNVFIKDKGFYENEVMQYATSSYE